MADFYSLLGLSRSASQGEIKIAFRKAAVEHHPDKWAPRLCPFRCQACRSTRRSPQSVIWSGVCLTGSGGAHACSAV